MNTNYTDAANGLSKTFSANCLGKRNKAREREIVKSGNTYIAEHIENCICGIMPGCDYFIFTAVEDTTFELQLKFPF